MPDDKSTFDDDEPTICPVLMDGLVNKLNELNRTAALEFSLRVGRLIVSEIYGGELSRWRSLGERDVSFRQLAARTHVDLRMSATTLYRSLALYELCSRLSVDLWRDFGAGHLRAVLGIPEREQVRLLSLAKVENLTARELDQRAAALRGRGAVRRPVQRGVAVKLLRQVAGLLRDTASSLSASDVDSLQTLVDEIGAHLGRVRSGEGRGVVRDQAWA